VTGAGLALVGVADEILLPRRVRRHERKLEAGREARSAAPAKARGLDLLDDRLAVELAAQHPLPRLVAADLVVVLERPRLAVELERREADEIALRHDLPPENGLSSPQKRGPPPPLRSVQRIEDLIDLLRREVLVVDVVHHHHRSADARREALLLTFQIDAAVRRALAGLDAELALDMRDDLVRAAQHARDVRAHRDVMPPDRLRLEHRVERRDLVDLDRQEIEILRDRVHQRLREISAVLVLHRVQRRDHGRALPARGKLRDPAIDLLAHVLGEHRLAFFRSRCVSVAHRSISPNTMSCVPITATTSASMCPCTISFIAARCANPGARTLTRYGLFAPSEIR